jgi:hypothetical protein
MLSPLARVRESGELRFGDHIEVRDARECE